MKNVIAASFVFRPILVMLGALLTACTNPILKSVDLDAGGGCSFQSNFAYALPTHVLKLDVEVVESPARYELLMDQYATAMEDRESVNCIDYLPSAFAEDDLIIERNPESLLLKTVSSKASDKSSDIALELIEGVAEGAAGTRANRAALARDEAKSYVLKDVAFDPFSRRDMQRVNGQLEKYGYCLFLMSHGDPFVPAWTPTLCNLEADDDSGKMPAASHAPVRGGGIKYRPLLPHRLVVMRKEDPGAVKFKLFRMLPFEMANAAPTFSVDVSRTHFAARKTKLTFTEGTLTGIELSKTSELAAATEIPLNIFKAGLGIPARALVLSTNEAENRAALINAQARLINTLRELELKKRDLEKVQPQQETIPNDNEVETGRKATAKQLAQRNADCLAAFEPGMQDETDPCGDISQQGD